ncbi:MarR family winged helix-turn-helix transcriptional regulator [Nakamurella sp. A5-74]|uniref:MarR family winged helix-turn-helix transcriptional regulator n=1 Tax=Nakamurella sp. A5-74 TaxID=3158264 RepID=A0AAU8DLT6_9ACTN
MIETVQESLVDVGSRLLTAVAGLNRWATAQAQTPFDIPYAQLRLLSLVGQLEPVRVTELAEADNCSQPTVTQQIRKLAALGWIDRADDPDDARASLLSLSARGNAAIGQARAARARAIVPLLADLEKADRETLVRATDLLTRLAATSSIDHRHPNRRTGSERGES